MWSLLSLCVLISVVFNNNMVSCQDTCSWYYWNMTTGDWPDGTTQDFRVSIGNLYYDSDDMLSRFVDQSWESVLYSNISYYRPLGYKYATLGPMNNPTICINVNDTKGYKVEIMVYTLTKGASICVKDMNSDEYDMNDVGVVEECSSQYLYKCFAANSVEETLNVAIYCKTGCLDMSNTDVLYRFRRSGSTYTPKDDSNASPEMWCMTIASDVYYPDSIQSSTPINYAGGNNNLFSSSNLIPLSLLLLSSLLLSTLFIVM